jgi:hypothetical protein
MLASHTEMEIAMARKGQHVVQIAGRWSVMTTGASRASKTYGTREQAIRDAREKAKSAGAKLYIHGSDGRITARFSFDGGELPPKG